MSLHAAVASELPRLQEAAESLMVETCRIDRVTGVTSDDEGRPVVDLHDPPVYVGIVKIQGYRPYPSEREVAGSTSVSQMYDTHIPASERMVHLIEDGAVEQWNGPVRNGDFMTRTTPGRAPEVYRVETEHDKSFQTAQRLVSKLEIGGITAAAVAGG